MNIFKNIIPGLILIISFQGCAQNNPSNSIDAESLKEKIRNNDSKMVILDVRTDAEITGPLPIIKGAIHIPVQEIEKRFNELDEYKDKEIVVICRTQNRSSVAADFLKRKGFNTKYVNGGMTEFMKK